MKNDPDTTASRTADAQLVRRALEGDEDAFVALFNAHRTKIYSLCLRMTSNTSEAEDLTEDAFLQAFRKLGTFRGDSPLSTWLYRAAVNAVLMHFRKNCRQGLRGIGFLSAGYADYSMKVAARPASHNELKEDSCQPF